MADTTAPTAPAPKAAPDSPTTPPAPWHGVNLGNWLLLEKWMMPSLFDGTTARDEFSLCESLGRRAAEVLNRHRDTFITQDDFAWLAARGFDAVRIPFGYWILDPDGPYVGDSPSGAPRHLDLALDWADRHRLAVILDLHGAPGHQSTADHTGRCDHWRWDKDPAHRARSLDLIELLARRYADRPSFRAGGISLLNEPHHHTGAGLLLDYYRAGYERVRRHSPDCAVIVEAFTSERLPLFHTRVEGTRVISDIHLYQGFSDQLKLTPVHQNCAIPLTGALPRIADYAQAGPLIVGEWSLGLGANRDLASMPPHRQRLAMRAFAAAQLFAYSTSAGHFFWSYKVEQSESWCLAWSLRDAIEAGWFPS